MIGQKISEVEIQDFDDYVNQKNTGDTYLQSSFFGVQLTNTYYSFLDSQFIS